MFAIREKTSRKFIAGTKAYGFEPYLVDINRARLYGRRCDASNSLGFLYHQCRNIKITPEEKVDYNNLEIVELKVTLEVVER